MFDVPIFIENAVGPDSGDASRWSITRNTAHGGSTYLDIHEAARVLPTTLATYRKHAGCFVLGVWNAVSRQVMLRAGTRRYNITKLRKVDKKCVHRNSRGGGILSHAIQGTFAKVPRSTGWLG